MGIETFEKIKKTFEKDSNGTVFVNEEKLHIAFPDELERNRVIDALNELQLEIKKGITVQNDNLFTNSVDNKQSKSKPKSIIETDVANNVIYEDYSELDKFLENEFIPENVSLKKKKKSEDNSDTLYPFIQLSAINKLNFNDLEFKHIMDYLKDKGIIVRGNDPTIDSEFENYDYWRTYKNEILPESLSSEETLEKFKIYSFVKDPVIREQLIIGNARLVPWIAYKYSITTGIDISELESFGYEGLIECVDKFDLSLGNKFSTYAVPYIRGYILRGINEIQSLNNKMNESLEELNEKSLDEDFDSNLELSTTFDLDKVESKEVNNSLKGAINKLLPTLTPKMAAVLELRYGLNGKEPSTYEQIAQIFNTRPERIRQTEFKALMQLRHPEKFKYLKEYVNVNLDTEIISSNKPKSL